MKYKFCYVVNFIVFDKPAFEVILSEQKMSKNLVELEVKNKTFDSAIEFKVTEYEIEIKKQTPL